MAITKQATKKSAGGKKATAKQSTRVIQEKMQKVMHEFRHGELKSGGLRQVTNPKQAIAIGLSEARQAGANVPARKGAKKAAKKTSKSTAKQR